MNRPSSCISNSEHGGRKKAVIFFIKLTALVAALLIFAIYVIGPQFDDSYQAVLRDKTDRVRAIDEPKIVLIGNSALAFGMDSALLERLTGMPVVNLGVHGGFGNAFTEEMAKQNINAGDIYVVCYPYYEDVDSFNDPSLVWTGLEYYFKYWNLLRLKDIPTMMTAYPTYFRKARDRWAEINTIPESGYYSRAAFNEYGDVEMYRQCQYTFDTAGIKVPTYNELCVNRLNKLAKYITERGAALVAAGYPIGGGEFTPPPEEFDKAQAALEEQFDFPFISHLTDYFIPYEYFFDTNRHLTTDGVPIYTRQLAKDINAYTASLK